MWWGRVQQLCVPLTDCCPRFESLLSSLSLSHTHTVWLLVSMVMEREGRREGGGSGVAAADNNDGKLAAAACYRRSAITSATTGLEIYRCLCMCVFFVFLAT